jgi:hypothetical protein
MTILEIEKKALGLHFVLLAIGEILKVDDFVTPQTLQNFITREEAFGGFRIPLADCRLALELMEKSGFIKGIGFDMYKYQRH